MWLRREFLKSIRGRSILACVLILGAVPFYQVAAQSIDLGFREGFALEDDPNADLALSSEADLESFDPLGEEGGPQSSASSFAPTIRQQLSRASRVGSAARFSQRVEAASRLSRASGGVTADEGVFDGETEQDRPDGFQLGSLRLTPSFDAGLGWTDNAEQARGGRPDGFYSVDTAVGVTSDWDRHELGLELRGSLRAFFREPDNNQPVIAAGGNLRLDMGELTTAELDGVYSFSREERSSAENEVATGRTNSVQGMGGRFSFSRQVALVQVRSGLGAERTVYGGQTSGAQPRDNTVFDATLRTSFDNGAVFEPYLEGGFLYRKYDESCHGDPSCFDRTSRGYLVKTGLTVDRGPKLRGEFGVGYRAEYLNDNRLDALQGLVFDGAFVWSPTRRDTVTVSAVTSFAGTNIDGSSGSILYAGDARYAHQFSPDLVGDIQLGYTYRTYQDVNTVEHEGTGSLGLAWAFSKDAALISRYTFQAFDSSSSDGSYTSSLIEAGLRIRR